MPRTALFQKVQRLFFRGRQRYKQLEDTILDTPPLPSARLADYFYEKLVNEGATSREEFNRILHSDSFKTVLLEDEVIGGTLVEDILKAFSLYKNIQYKEDKFLLLIQFPEFTTAVRALVNGESAVIAEQLNALIIATDENESQYKCLSSRLFGG